MKRYVAACSFGKDSMATVILALKHKEPLDEVVYCEVMFDEETSGEVPEHRDFVYGVAIPFLKRVGIPVHVVKSEKTFVGQFQHRIGGDGRSAGKIWSWPLCGKCYVQRDLKVRPMDVWKRANWSGDEIVQYVGIADDEMDRLARMDSYKYPTISLLEKYNVTEDGALALCRKHGLLSPIYEFAPRNGCFFCTKTGVLQEPDCGQENCPYYATARDATKSVQAVWHNNGGPCWTFETDIPHETFNIYEDGELFCVGIVLSVEDL